MILVGDPERTGFLRRFVRVYREKRKRVPVRELDVRRDWSSLSGYASELRTHQRRMPRWAAGQIAWHQARNAKDAGC